MADLQEIEAIKRVKYKYMRCVDSKRWEEMADCFTEDATSAYSDGKYSFQGREAIINWLREAMNSPTVVSAHHVHHPEIDLTSPTTAKGIWAMEDTFTDTGGNFTLRGAGFYEDEYVKIDGQWKIKHIGYRRTFEEVFSRTDTPSLTMLVNCWIKQ